MKRFAYIYTGAYGSITVLRNQSTKDILAQFRDTNVDKDTIKDFTSKASMGDLIEGAQYVVVCTNN